MTFLVKLRLLKHLQKMEHERDAAMVVATVFGTITPDNDAILKLTHAIRETYTEKQNPESMIEVEI